MLTDYWWTGIGRGLGIAQMGVTLWKCFEKSLPDTKDLFEFTYLRKLSWIEEIFSDSPPCFLNYLLTKPSFWVLSISQLISTLLFFRGLCRFWNIPRCFDEKVILDFLLTNFGFYRFDLTRKVILDFVLANFGFYRFENDIFKFRILHLWFDKKIEMRNTECFVYISILQHG